MKLIFAVMHSCPMKRKNGKDKQLHTYAVDPHVLAIFDSYEDAIEYIERFHSDFEKDGTVWTTPIKTLPGTISWNTYGKIWIEAITIFTLKES